MRARVVSAVVLIYAATASAGSGRAEPKEEGHLAERITYLLDRIEAIVVRDHPAFRGRAGAERMSLEPVVAPASGRSLREGR